MSARLLPVDNSPIFEVYELPTGKRLPTRRNAPDRHLLNLLKRLGRAALFHLRALVLFPAL
jgi:hypothetical protein